MSQITGHISQIIGAVIDGGDPAGHTNPDAFR